MNAETLLGFSVFAFVASVTPGPNNVLLTATGGAVGIARGMPVLFGIVSGFAAMVFLLTLGLGQFIVADPTVLDALRYIGIAFLLWLSWKIATAPVAEAGQDSTQSEAGRSFWSAALFQWVNPKAWLVVASAIASYAQIGEDSLWQAIRFATVFIVSGLLGCFPWLAFGAYIRRWLKSRRASRIFNILMGLMLAASLVFIAP